MRMIIQGAGRVGESVAESLVSEQNDITVIDPDPDLLRKLEDRLDLRGVVGDGIQPSVQRRAGADDADLFIACASLDETNLAACKVARSMFGIQTTIARLRSPEFEEGQPLLAADGFAVDHVICPEESLMQYINQLIDYPEALQVLEFSQGRAHLIAVRAESGSVLVNHSIGEFRELFPQAPMRVVAIFRQDFELPIDPSTQVWPGDEVFVLADKAKIRPVLRAIHNDDRPVRSVMIAGGGKVGLRLARSLSGQCQVKIIEANRKRAEYLAGELPGDIMVLSGDSTDEELLIEERVGEMDLFIALTSDDEDNILSAMLAKRLGARRVISLIDRRVYAEMMQGSAIDIALSPAQTVIGELLVHVRRGDVAAVHSLRRGAAEAIEGIARGDQRTSRLVGRRVDAIELPTGARFGAIVRGKDAQCEVMMPHHDLVILEGDHVIIYVPNKRQLRAVEKMFQVSATFFLAAMNGLTPVLNVLGIILVGYSLMFLVPLGWALSLDQSDLHGVWAIAMAATLGTGLLLLLLTRRRSRELQPRDGFLLVNLVWIVLPAFSALPLMMTIGGLSWTDAYFEAMSGLTATGATVLTGLDQLPVSVNIWRGFLQLIGGLGIMLLVVAVLPLLGLGGVQLYKAETPGPMKDARLTPRIAETARGLWGVYFSFSLACMLAYRWAGMSWADAFIHMCSTMGLGGFSSHDASFGYWNSTSIEYVAIAFMALAGISFARYFIVWRTLSARSLMRDREVSTYAQVLLGSSVCLTVLLMLLSGLDIVTAFSAVVATVNNIGPGLGQVGPSTTFAILNDFQTWIGTVGMLMGRLELLAVIVLFTPEFWRK